MTSPVELLEVLRPSRRYTDRKTQSVWLGDGFPQMGDLCEVTMRGDFFQKGEHTFTGIFLKFDGTTPTSVWYFHPLTFTNDKLLQGCLADIGWPNLLRVRILARIRDAE